MSAKKQRLMFQRSFCRRRSPRIHWSERGRRSRSVYHGVVNMLFIAMCNFISTDEGRQHTHKNW